MSTEHEFNIDNNIDDDAFEPIGLKQMEVDTSKTLESDFMRGEAFVYGLALIAVAVMSSMNMAVNTWVYLVATAALLVCVAILKRHHNTEVYSQKVYLRTADGNEGPVDVITITRMVKVNWISAYVSYRKHIKMVKRLNAKAREHKFDCSGYKPKLKYFRYTTVSYIMNMGDVQVMNETSEKATLFGNVEVQRFDQRDSKVVGKYINLWDNFENYREVLAIIREAYNSKHPQKETKAA